MEFVINEAVRSCCWRPAAECDCLLVNFDESKHPRADDGKFGSGSGTPTKGADAKGESSGAAKVANVLAKIAKTSYASAKVSAKVVAAGSKVLGSGLKMAYDRYGDKGSIGMFLVANAVYGGSAILTGGAAPVAAAAFGLAAMETRHLMKKFVKKLDSDTVGGKSFHANADDADGLAKLCLVVVRRFASATGLPTPKIDLAGVKKILDDNDLTANCGGVGGKPGPCPEGGAGTPAAEAGKPAGQTKPLLQKIFDAIRSKDGGRHGREAKRQAEEGAKADAGPAPPGHVAKMAVAVTSFLAKSYPGKAAAAAGAIAKKIILAIPLPKKGGSRKVPTANAKATYGDLADDLMQAIEAMAEDIGVEVPDMDRDDLIAQLKEKLAGDTKEA